MIFAPMATRLSVKNIRPSNIFSKKITVPSACVATVMATDIMSVGNIGQGASSIFGIWLRKSDLISSF